MAENIHLSLFGICQKTWLKNKIWVDINNFHSWFLQNVPSCRSLMSQAEDLKSRISLRTRSLPPCSAEREQALLWKTTFVFQRKNKIINILHLFGCFSLLFLTAVKYKHVWDVWIILGGENLLCSLKNSKWRIVLTAHRFHFQMGFFWVKNPEEDIVPAGFWQGGI